MLNSSKQLIVDARMYNHSGIGVYLKNILPKLIEGARKNNISISLIGNENELSNLGAKKIHHSDAKIYSIKEQFEIASISNCYDALWVPHYNIPIMHRKKLIVTVHDVAHLALDDFKKSKAKNLYAQLLFTAIRLKSDKIITVSDFTKKELIRYSGINSNKISVIHNGVGREWFTSDIQSEVTVADKEYDFPYFVYVGNVKPHKNLVRLVKAFESVMNEIPHKMIIVGKKDGFITGDKTVAEYASKFPDKIIFTGYIEDKKLIKIVKEADFLVMPSLYEGFGLPPLEAMASATPVASSNAASLPEVCGEAVLYFDPLNISDIARAIKEIASDDNLRKDLSKKGLMQAEKFNWHTSAKLHLDAIINEV